MDHTHDHSHGVSSSECVPAAVPIDHDHAHNHGHEVEEHFSAKEIRCDSTCSIEHDHNYDYITDFSAIQGTYAQILNADTEDPTSSSSSSKAPTEAGKRKKNKSQCGECGVEGHSRVACPEFQEALLKDDPDVPVDKRRRLIGEHSRRRLEGVHVPRINTGTEAGRAERSKCIMCSSKVTVWCRTCRCYVCIRSVDNQDSCWDWWHFKESFDGFKKSY